MQIKGKNALITGASRGIGVHIARALAGKGANVGLVARNAAGLEDVARELGSLGVRAVPLAADLSDFDSYPALAERAIAALGSVDILVNNAALEAQAPFTEFPRQTIEAYMDVDLVGPMLLTQALLPRWLEARSGHVVNIASLAGKSGTPYNAVYSAAKGGLIAFSHSLRSELEDRGIGVSTVSPGFISDVGMFAAKSHETGQPSAIIGTSTSTAVAKAVVKAIESNRAEVVVNPGPIRFFLALNQFFPDLMPRVSKRAGLGRMFEAASRVDRPKLLSGK